MNVYFLDPKYLKPESWKPLLQYLKVKVALSFIPKDKLAAELVSIIDPYLVYSYSGEDMKTFTNNCVYWLREHFEKNIRLVTEDFSDVKSMSAEDRKKYSSQSPHNNLLALDAANCLILIELNSLYDERGNILAPECKDLKWDGDLPTQIASYCLNILHKKHQHDLYYAQSAFVTFDEYFSKTYRYVHKARQGSYMREVRKWERCVLKFKDKRVDFIQTINRGVHTLSTDNFPLIEEDGKKKYTHLITDKGYDNYQTFLDEAKEQAERYEDEQWAQSEGEDWQKEVEEMNKAFWRECGEAGSNCDS